MAKGAAPAQTQARPEKTNEQKGEDGLAEPVPKLKKKKKKKQATTKVLLLVTTQQL